MPSTRQAAVGRPLPHRCSLGGGIRPARGRGHSPRACARARGETAPIPGPPRTGPGGVTSVAGVGRPQDLICSVLRREDAPYGSRIPLRAVCAVGIGSRQALALAVLGIDDPRGTQTVVNGLNDQSGVFADTFNVVGSYWDSPAHVHGFIATVIPPPTPSASGADSGQSKELRARHAAGP